MTVLEKQVQNFLASGGKITYCPTAVARGVTVRRALSDKALDKLVLKYRGAK
jgi:hypothetical protein